MKIYLLIQLTRSANRVGEYWGDHRYIVTVYNFEADTMIEYLFGEVVPVGTYEGFYIKIL